MEIEIRTCDETLLPQVKALIEEYARRLGRDLSFQHLGEELEGIQSKYSPPNGELLAAVERGTVFGIVAYRRHSDARCEMKRLYVSPAARGRKLGELLVTAVIEHAARAGYAEMVLDTIKPLKAAIALYKKHGFRECAPYYDNPMADVIYMRLELANAMKNASQACHLGITGYENHQRLPLMQFNDKSVVVTGGAQGIGKCIAECFRREGATVHVIDKQDGPWFVGDLADKATLERFAADVIAKSGKVDVLVNNAMPLFKGIDECTYEEFANAQAVGVVAPFYLAKLFKDYFAKGASIINISSSRDRMSQPQTESYTAAKGGIAALTHALAASLAGRVRVNSISPGWIDTSFKEYDGPDAAQHFAGRVGNPKDIANMVLYLASDKAGFITGENICIDGGMTRSMIYHNDFGWRFEK